MRPAFTHTVASGRLQSQHKAFPRSTEELTPQKSAFKFVSTSLLLVCRYARLVRRSISPSQPFKTSSQVKV